MALPVSSKYGENVLDTDKLATNACKIASKRMIQKTAVARVDLVGNKIAEKTTKAATKDNHDEDLRSHKYQNQQVNQRKCTYPQKSDSKL